MSHYHEATILDVNLTDGSWNFWKLPVDIHRLYPGGAALGMYLGLQDIPDGLDPLSPNNILIFSVTNHIGMNERDKEGLIVTTKSPLTGTISDTKILGTISGDLKSNGYDAVIVRGESGNPVYLYISGTQISLRRADMAWGMVTGEAEKEIKSDLNDQSIEMALIGPAGENLIKYARVISPSSRVNGQNGAGAVMGAKRLKAMVVKKSIPSNETA